MVKGSGAGIVNCKNLRRMYLVNEQLLVMKPISKFFKFLRCDFLHAVAAEVLATQAQSKHVSSSTDMTAEDVHAD